MLRSRSEHGRHFFFSGSSFKWCTLVAEFLFMMFIEFP
jgi:hypothetical protein